MQKLLISHEAAVSYAANTYARIYNAPYEPSDPLTKALGSVVPDNLDSWLKENMPLEAIGERHHCGFYIYMTLSALEDLSAFSLLLFDTAWEHTCGAHTRPDKAIIQTSFEAGHLIFAEHSGRKVFMLSDLGCKHCLTWLHQLMPTRMPDFPSP